MRSLMLGTMMLASAVAGFVSLSAPVYAQEARFDTNGPAHQNSQCWHRPQAGTPDYFGYYGPCDPPRQGASGRNAHASGNGDGNFYAARFDSNGPMQQNGSCRQRVQTGVPDYFSFSGACAPSGRR